MFPTLKLTALAATTLLLLLPSTLAAPTTPNTPVLFSRGAKSVNDCGESSFDSLPADRFALAADCRVIASNIANGGTWTVEASTGNPHQLVQYGTCAFGVKLVQASEGWQYKVGNQDIIDLITTSIEKFEKDGLVAARGIMQCEALVGHPMGVYWAIYRQ